MSSLDFGYSDGSTHYTGAPTSIPRHTYTVAGVYTAQATVIDSLSHTHHVAVSIGLNTVAEVRTQLCSVYAYLRDRLNANDVTNALNAFSIVGKDRYQGYLSAGTTSPPAIGASLGTLAGGTIAQTYAEVMAVTDQGTTITASAVQFVRGNDGVWRIESF